MGRVRGIFHVADQEPGRRRHGSIQSAPTGSFAPRRVGCRSPPETTNRTMRTQSITKLFREQRRQTMNNEQRTTQAKKRAVNQYSRPLTKAEDGPAEENPAAASPAAEEQLSLAERRRCRRSTRQARGHKADARCSLPARKEVISYW